MVVPRTSPRWITGLMNSSARSARAVTRTGSWQQIQRRAYPASEGHRSHKSSGDLPWAIGAAVVTIPSVAYLLQPSPKDDHGHGHEGDDHGVEGGDHGVEEHTEEGKNSESGQAEGEAGDDSEEEGGSAATPSDDDTSSESNEQPRPDHSVNDAGQGTPESPRDEFPKGGGYEVESGGNVEGVRFKGATAGGTREGEGGRREQGDVRKHIPDAKGGAKKRISSDYAKPQGKSAEDDDGSNNRAAAASTPSDRSPAAKQEGLSNTDTKHSTDLDNNPDKSKKGEGFVETAKAKGPVDPSRPQAENRPGEEGATGSQADT
ncbi:MAG: hypothetical protein L6R35_003214 [Caloplaca aegaea]|nr:MAG: hypothetical protein L6R35_003214 [Caloplaca aegaea]